MEGKRGTDLQTLTEIADNDVLIVDTAGGTRAITYAQLCAAVKDTLGIREVVESTNITEPGFLMDGKTASEAFAELYSKFGYTDILNDVISEDKSKITVSYAYVLNGIAVISLLLKSGIQPGPHPFHISNPKYFPKATVYGIYASTQSAMDNGKLNSATISSLGSGSIYIGEAITYDNEGVMFMYPINL